MSTCQLRLYYRVASFTDAWIETAKHEAMKLFNKVASFTDAWIETFIYIVCEDSMESHLLQMRGLKLSYNKRVCKLHPSHLLQMRGLKQRGIINTLKSLTSHLLQMRGLKLCVVLNNNLLSHVASFTDAWIETIMARTAKALALSHLLQMRGLKHWG